MSLELLGGIFDRMVILAAASCQQVSQGTRWARGGLRTGLKERVPNRVLCKDCGPACYEGVEEGHDETTRGRERWRMQEIYPDRAPASLGCVVAVIASLVMNMGVVFDPASIYYVIICCHLANRRD